MTPNRCVVGMLRKFRASLNNNYLFNVLNLKSWCGCHQRIQKLFKKAKNGFSVISFVKKMRMRFEVVIGIVF